MFRHKKGVRLKYNQQGYVYFTSQAYKDLPESEQRKIERICLECAGEYARALLAFVTTEENATAICEKYYISRSTLYRCVRKYYERAWKELRGQTK